MADNYEVCEHCKKPKPDAHECRNPYQWDVNNVEVMEIICNECYAELCDDI